jgi:cytochrome P450
MTLGAAIGLVNDHKWSVLTSIVLHVTTTCIYRRFFHPLAKIPGPFLPAVTKLYQSYYNCRYYLEIERLHDRYGPVVRITPDEVHIATNSDDYDKIYHVGSKYSKSPNFYNALCVPHSSVGTASNEMHKIKRGAMNPIFARQKVLDVESIVQDKVAKVIRRLESSVSKTSVANETGVDLHHAFRAVSVDVASEFAFGNCYNFLDKSDTGAKFFEMARGIGPALYAFQQFPSLQILALKIPPWLAPLLSRPLGYVTSMQAECIRQIESVKEKMSQGHDTGRSTIFTTLLSEDDKPDGFRVPTTLELKDEAYSVLVAAADTTGNAMTVAAFNVIYNPVIYEKLAKELESCFPDKTSQLPFVELERLPYLVSNISYISMDKTKLTWRVPDSGSQGRLASFIRRCRPLTSRGTRPWRLIRQSLPSLWHYRRHVLVDDAPRPRSFSRSDEVRPGALAAKHRAKSATQPQYGTLWARLKAMCWHATGLRRSLRYVGHDVPKVPQGVASLQYYAGDHGGLRRLV